MRYGMMVIMEELQLVTSTPNVSGYYMYTDFTGAALYKGANDLNYDFQMRATLE